MEKRKEPVGGFSMKHRCIKKGPLPLADSEEKEKKR